MSQEQVQHFVAATPPGHVQLDIFPRHTNDFFFRQFAGTFIKWPTMKFIRHDRQSKPSKQYKNTDYSSLSPGLQQ